MALKGFDPRWKDFPDYIIGITKEIWEDRKIHTLHQYYSDDIVVRSPAGIVRGNKSVIADTMRKLAEFPDRQLLGEDVIWSGDEDEDFLSSHRILSTATHSKPGMFGPPTGKKVSYRIIADCAAKDNVIHDEWLAYDQGAIVRQMGWELEAYARDSIEREGGPEKCVKPFTPDIDQIGSYKGKGNSNEYGQRYADILKRIVSGEMSAIPSEYDRACHLEYPGGFTGHSHADADQFWMGLRASFPSATFEIHHQIGRTDESLSPRAALRWSLTGKHDGWGTFGAPSGADVHVFGMCHAEFGPWGLRREYVMFDETAIWRQIVLQSG